MSNQRIVPLSFDKPATANGTSSIQLSDEKNVTIQSVHLQYKTNATNGTIKSDIENIRLKLGTRTQFELTATQLVEINEHLGHTFTNGFLDLFFADPKRPSPQSQKILGLPTARIERNAAGDVTGIGEALNLMLQVDVASGASNPTLEGFMVVEDEVQEPEFMRYFVQEVNNDLTSRNIRDIDEGIVVLDTLILRETETGDDISTVKVYDGKVKILEYTAAQNAKRLTDIGRVEPTDTFAIAMGDGLMSTAYRLKEKFKITVEQSAGSDFEIVAMSPGGFV